MVAIADSHRERDVEVCAAGLVVNGCCCTRGRGLIGKVLGTQRGQLSAQRLVELTALAFAAPALALRFALALCVGTPLRSVVEVALPLALALALVVAAAVPAAEGGARGSHLGERRRLHLGREVQHLAEVFDALVREEVVVPLPVELLREVAAGGQGPQDHHDVQVRDVLELVVLAGAGVVLDAHNPLLEQVLQDNLAVLLRDQHHGWTGKLRGGGRSALEYRRAKRA
mmetsp:Transcript_2153/g.5662  ORF Transcript_2153/g.5662 Transcript_2153/m.5662 type:complete len:228 (-) Transcript_2153:8-691(-)